MSSEDRPQRSRTEPPLIEPRIGKNLFDKGKKLADAGEKGFFGSIGVFQFPQQNGVLVAIDEVQSAHLSTVNLLLAQESALPNGEVVTIIEYVELGSNGELWKVDVEGAQRSLDSWIKKQITEWSGRNSDSPQSTHVPRLAAVDDSERVEDDHFLDESLRCAIENLMGPIPETPSELHLSILVELFKQNAIEIRPKTQFIEKVTRVVDTTDPVRDNITDRYLPEEE